MWRIKGTHEKDIISKVQLYWSNDVGWTYPDFAETYTDDERERLDLPIGGEWEEIL